MGQAFSFNWKAYKVILETDREVLLMLEPVDLQNWTEFIFRFRNIFQYPITIVSCQLVTPSGGFLQKRLLNQVLQPDQSIDILHGITSVDPVEIAHHN